MARSLQRGKSGFKSGFKNGCKSGFKNGGKYGCKGVDTTRNMNRGYHATAETVRGECGNIAAAGRLRRLQGDAIAHATLAGAVERGRLRFPHRQNEIGDARRDLGAEARAVEHAVMTDALLQPMGMAVRRDVRAQAVRRFGLADAGNVVELAFDSQERGVRDPARIDR